MKLSRLIVFSMIVVILGALPLTARADVNTGLAAYYKFNSTSGTSATDSSGNGNTATLVNGAAFVSTGKFYYGVTLDGSNDKITAAASPSMDSTSFTIATWAYFKSTTATQYLVEKGITGTSANYYFYYLSPNFICGFYDGTPGIGWRQLQVAATPTANAWEHYACTFDNVSKVMTMYRNGASIGNTTLNYVPQTNTGDLYVGWSIVQANDSFNGYLDDTRVYSRALTSSDISELYNYSPPNTSCSSPAGNGGDITYDATARIMGYCNSASWIQIGAGPKGGGGCTNPSKSAGAIIYDAANRVMKHCNGQEWATWGVVGGIGVASSCTSPTGVAGALTYNADYRVLQYCDGKTWEMVGGYQPTISMDFLADKYTLNGTSYSGVSNFITASGATFTRASTAMYFNSAGTMTSASSGAPRLDYDPVTHLPKGILIENTGTNKALQSSAFNTASWTSGGPTVTANVAVAPDGTTTADNINPTGSGLAFMAQALSWTAGQTVTFSVFVKANGASLVFFQEKVAGTLWGTQFDLTTGTISNIKAGDTPTMQSVGNGWWRISMTRTFAAATGANNQYNTIYVDQYNGTGTAGHAVYLWGAQFEIYNYPTSYIPTTTGPITRAEDVFTMPTRTWFDNTKGTLLSQYMMPYLGGAGWPGSVAIDDGNGPGDNAIHLFVSDASDDGADAEIWTGGSEQFGYSGGVIYTPGTVGKQVITYKKNSVYAASNGNLSTQGTSVTIPTVTMLRVGAVRGGDGPLDGWVQGISYYPFNVPPAVAQTMTRANP